MVIVVKKPKLSWRERLYVIELATGMLVTARHFLRNLFNPSGLPTLNYPEEKRKLAPNFRGLHRLTKKETGELKCTACNLCAVACPADCIVVEMARDEKGKPKKSPERYDLDISRCVFCGFCVEACPFDAIRMDTGMYELASGSLKDAILSKETLSSFEGAYEEANEKKDEEEKDGGKEKS